MIQFTEKQLIEFTEYMIANKRKFVSDADMRNFFGDYYDCIKHSRKTKLEKISKI